MTCASGISKSLLTLFSAFGFHQTKGQYQKYRFLMNRADIVSSKWFCQNQADPFFP
jgi:hypothetical protein